MPPPYLSAVLCAMRLLRRSARVALYMAMPPPYVPCRNKRTTICKVDGRDFGVYLSLQACNNHDQVWCRLAHLRDHTAPVENTRGPACNGHHHVRCGSAHVTEHTAPAEHLTNHMAPAAQGADYVAPAEIIHSEGQTTRQAPASRLMTNNITHHVVS
jgi:hypothetical protein